MNFMGVELPVFKAALHTHSTVSDGQMTPDWLLEAFAADGFDVFNFSDHKLTNPVSSYDHRNMTVISGIELHPQGPHGTTWHLLAVGVPEDFPGEYATAQDAVDAVNAVGGVIFCAHPAWCGITSVDIAEIKGLAGLEVFNTSCVGIAKANSETIWNELTDRGIFYPALAVDDIHADYQVGRNWTMIAAPDKSRESIIAALKAGHFYATQGPEFTKLTIEDGMFSAEFTEVEEAVLIGVGPSGHYEAMKDYPNKGDHKLVTSLVQPVEKYWLQGPFRCRIKDVNGNYAWSPVLTLPEK